LRSKPGDSPQNPLQKQGLLPSGSPLDSRIDLRGRPRCDRVPQAAHAYYLPKEPWLAEISESP